MSNRSRYHATPHQSGTGWTGKLVAIFTLVLVASFGVAFAKYLRTVENQSTNISFASSERIDDSTLRVWADISRKDVSVPAYCIVTALNYDMAEVGRREVYIPPGGPTQQRIETDIATRELAVAGGAYGCSEDIPFYLDTSG